jgi:hypothetical protein
MSLFRGEQRAMSSWSELGVSPSSAVTQTGALCLTPYFAAVRHMVHYVSTLPVDFYRRDNEETRTPVGPPELIRNVDTEYGIGTWLGQVMFGFATRGNAVGEATMFSGFNLPTMVRWSGEWSGGDNGTPFFVDGKSLPNAKVVHVSWGVVPPGKRIALDPVSAAAATIKAGLSAQDYADVKRGGGIPPAILKNTKKVLDREAAQKIQAAAVTSFANGKPFVSGNDWDLVFPTVPPNHAQFLDTLKTAANATASIFGIDPREIGGQVADSLTYVNDESRALKRAQDMRPYLVMIENAVSRLLPERQYMKFNIDATIRSDIKSRTDVAIKEIEHGISSVNEYRALTDRKPVPGGDFYNVPAPKADPTTRGETP